MKAKILILCGCAATLSACGEDPVAEPTEENSQAQGEILEGTISDEMLPLESLQSQAPRADGKVEEDTASSGEESE